MSQDDVGTSALWWKLVNKGGNRAPVLPLAVALGIKEQMAAYTKINSTWIKGLRKSWKVWNSQDKTQAQIFTILDRAMVA